MPLPGWHERLGEVRLHRLPGQKLLCRCWPGSGWPSRWIGIYLAARSLLRGWVIRVSLGDRRLGCLAQPLQCLSQWKREDSSVSYISELVCKEPPSSMCSRVVFIPLQWSIVCRLLASVDILGSSILGQLFWPSNMGAIPPLLSVTSCNFEWHGFCFASLLSRTMLLRDIVIS